MENERKIGKFALKKRDILIATALAAAISVVPSNNDMDSHEPYKYESIPEKYFNPIIIYQDKTTDSLDLKIPKVVDKKIDPTPLPLTKEQINQQEINQELKKVVEKLKDASVGKKYIKDVKIYYPIYKAVAEKFDMDWYLIWIVHEKETGASAGWRGFTESSYYKGAMQRDPHVWPQSFVEKAAKGLKDLADVPQRRKNDWKEIAAGAKILDRNIDHYLKNRGNNKNAAVHKALKLYSADGPAEVRYEMYLKYKEIFKS